MTDHQQNDDIKINQALMTLDWDVQPDRDLWADISSRIRFAGKPKTKQYNWAPAAVAACMLFAFGALILSSMSFKRSQQTYAMQASYIDYQKSQINLIEQQHKHVRAQFISLLSGQHGSIDPETVAEVQAVLMTIDSASVELKQAILAQPLNTNYSTKLARTYQDELKLLNKFQSKSGTSI
jgi:hypothetical protein